MDEILEIRFMEMLKVVCTIKTDGVLVPDPPAAKLRDRLK